MIGQATPARLNGRERRQNDNSKIQAVPGQKESEGEENEQRD